MSEIKSLIDILSDLATFYSHQLDEKELKVYVDIFKDYTNSELVCAINKHQRDIKKGMFFPFPADLLNYLSSKVIQFPYHRDFPKIKHERRSSVETAEKYLKEIRDVLKKS